MKNEEDTSETTVIAEEKTISSSVETTQSSDNYATNNPLLNKDKFFNRRKMAWMSMYLLAGQSIFVLFFLMISLLLFFLFPDIVSGFIDKYKLIMDWVSTMMTWSYSATVAIIMSYMGTTTFAYGKFLQSKKIDEK